jgi:hypothetical protein
MKIKRLLFLVTCVSTLLKLCKKKKNVNPNAQASSESSLPPAPIQPFFQGFKQKILKPIFKASSDALHSIKEYSLITSHETTALHAILQTPINMN